MNHSDPSAAFSLVSTAPLFPFHLRYHFLPKARNGRGGSRWFEPSAPVVAPFLATFALPDSRTAETCLGRHVPGQNVIECKQNCSELCRHRRGFGFSGPSRNLRDEHSTRLGKPRER